MPRSIKVPVTEPILPSQSLWTVVDEIRVFARMTPQGKATVRRLKCVG